VPGHKTAAVSSLGADEIFRQLPPVRFTAGIWLSPSGLRWLPHFGNRCQFALPRDPGMPGASNHWVAAGYWKQFRRVHAATAMLAHAICGGKVAANLVKILLEPPAIWDFSYGSDSKLYAGTSTHIRSPNVGHAATNKTAGHRWQAFQFALKFAQLTWGYR
jgi:hypothetical protein